MRLNILFLLKITTTKIIPIVKKMITHHHQIRVAKLWQSAKLNL